MRRRRMRSARSTVEARRDVATQMDRIPESILLAHENQASGCAEFHGPIPHGDFCSCSALADAVGTRHSTISFEFCRTVLQKRWTMTCRHGLTRAEAENHAKATLVGRLDSVQAILASNL